MPTLHTMAGRICSLLLTTALLGPQMAGAQAPAFGRLFHTQAQRTELEQQRDQPPPRVASPAPVAPPQPQPAFIIDGILRRSDGLHIVWLNGEAVALPPGLHLAPGPALVLIPDAAPRQRLQVGDRWPAPPVAERP